MILGIETSCDETSAAVVDNGRTVLSNVIVSSLKDHVKFGGVIPEIASRRQLEYINTVVTKALDEAGVTLADIDAVAYTQEPGLIGSLLVGISFAKALGFALKKPFYPVDHIRAHLYANFLQGPTNNNKNKLPVLPAIGLVVSGGHTSLYLVKSIHQFRLIGQTLDDAAGEAFDKVARILGLGYPGGPVIDRLAKQVDHSRVHPPSPNDFRNLASADSVRKIVKADGPGEAKGESTLAKTGQIKASHRQSMVGLHFTCAQLPGSFDFSFSGIKTAILYYYRDHKNDPDVSLAEIAHAFEKSVVDVLVAKSLLACRKYRIKTLLIGGGVAANSMLRQRLSEEAGRQAVNVHFPPLSLCLDNAAMIAGLGYHSTKKNPH